MEQIETLVSAIHGYFDLMYHAENKRFADVFDKTCVIHGMRDGAFVAWPAAEFRAIMRGRQSPASM